MTITFGTFKIFMDKKNKWYYKVYIFSRQSSMYKLRQMMSDEDKATKMKKHNYSAICSSFPSKFPENKYQYGVLMFTVKSSSNSGIVAHEMAHAINYWWKGGEKYTWLDIPKNKKADERFAWLFGSMLSQYWRNWYKLVELKKK